MSNKGGRLKKKILNTIIVLLNGVVFNASGSFTTSKHGIHKKGNKASFKLR